MTYVGQNYGAGKIDRIFKGVKASMIMSIGVTVGLGAVICAVPEYLFMLFSKQESVINLACDMIWKMVPFYALLAIAKIYSSAVSGTGNSMVPMAVNIMFMCVIRMITIPVFTSSMGYTMDVLYYTYYVSWVLTAVVIGGYYHICTKKQLKRLSGMV
jgi:Na+-driven multidrug efflux pump